MALILCKECRAEISTKALACPKCGAVRSKKDPPMSAWSITGIALLIVILLFTIPIVLFKIFHEPSVEAKRLNKSFENVEKAIEKAHEVNRDYGK